jgi:predicted phage-related endonuclease
VEQRSDEWFAARVGSLGASKIGQALSHLKRSGERTATALDFMLELAAERLTGQPAKQVNPRDWGAQHEDEARASYAFLTNLPVVKIGLIAHPTIANAHASPDSLVGDEGGLEIKCPTSTTHLRTLLDDAIPEEHLPQIHWNLACSGRKWWDFVSYDPRFPDGLQFFQKRVERDEAEIARLEAEAIAWLAELEDKLKALDARYPLEAA